MVAMTIEKPSESLSFFTQSLPACVINSQQTTLKFLLDPYYAEPIDKYTYAWNARMNLENGT